MELELWKHVFRVSSLASESYQRLQTKECTQMFAWPPTYGAMEFLKQSSQLCHLHNSSLLYDKEGQSSLLMSGSYPQFRFCLDLSPVKAEFVWCEFFFYSSFVYCIHFAYFEYFLFPNKSFNFAWTYFFMFLLLFV
jgi:hypothetical protein